MSDAGSRFGATSCSGRETSDATSSEGFRKALDGLKELYDEAVASGDADRLAKELGQVAVDLVMRFMKASRAEWPQVEGRNAHELLVESFLNSTSIATEWLWSLRGLRPDALEKAVRKVFRVPVIVSPVGYSEDDRESKRRKLRPLSVERAFKMPIGEDLWHRVKGVKASDPVFYFIVAYLPGAQTILRRSGDPLKIGLANELDAISPPTKKKERIQQWADLAVRCLRAAGDWNRWRRVELLNAVSTHLETKERARLNRKKKGLKKRLGSTEAEDAAVCEELKQIDAQLLEVQDFTAFARMVNTEAMCELAGEPRYPPEFLERIKSMAWSEEEQWHALRELIKRRLKTLIRG